MRIWVAALLILCACRSSTGPDLDGHATSLADFERRLDILRGELAVPGMSVGISEGNHIVWSRGLGHADIERGIAASPTTDFHIASLTKGFAAIILVKLASAGTTPLS